VKALIIGSSGQIGNALAVQCALRNIAAAGAGIAGESLRLDLAPRVR